GVASDLERVKRNEAELQAANRAKGEFLARASHELRTPLHGILGSTEMALLDRSLENRPRHLVESAQRSARSLLSIVDELLQLHQLEVA
ncbi:hypothetical protein NL503_28140, partial [Klebsiella pneumoniae]|nr:hypothetical protein [Klebsiella pneumoniae]